MALKFPNIVKDTLALAFCCTGLGIPVIAAIAIVTGLRSDRKLDKEQQGKPVIMPVLPDRYI